MTVEERRIYLMPGVTTYRVPGLRRVFQCRCETKGKYGGPVFSELCLKVSAYDIRLRQPGVSGLYRFVAQLGEAIEISPMPASRCGAMLVLYCEIDRAPLPEKAQALVDALRRHREAIVSGREL